MADQYLDQAIALLALPDLDETAVHEVRVLMKQLRGLVRLYGGDELKPVVREINVVLRDVAKVFAARRDAHVLAETLEQVARRSNRRVATELRRILQEVTLQTADVLPELEPQSLVADLQRVRELWRQRLQQPDDEFLADALARSYRRNRREGREALRQRETHAMHDWRKRVKYFYYQLGVLNTADEWLQQQKDMLRKLGSLLGKVHDLDVLDEYLWTTDATDLVLLRHISKRRVRLVKKINALYLRVFAHPAKRYRRKLET